MEVIGRICPKLIPPILQDLKDCIEKFESINSNIGVGLSKNNILLEFDNEKGNIFRGHKMSRICTDFKVLHDLDGKYLIVLIFKDDYFEVIKPRKDENRYESVYISDKTIVALDILDDVKGHEVIRVQYSPTTHEILDFVEKRTQFQAPSEAVEKSLQWQLEHAEKSVQAAKNEVSELEQILKCAITDLASNDPNPNVNIKEVDVIKSLFNRDDFNFTRDSKISLDIKDFKMSQFQPGQPVVLLYKIKNESNFSISDIKMVLLNEGKHKIKILRETLDEMINTEIVKGISNGFGVKTTQHSDKEKTQKNNLRVNQEMSILLQVHPKNYNEKLDLQLQFITSESKTKSIQKLPKIALKKDNSDETEKLTENQDIYAKIAFSDIKKCLRIYSILDRPFELEIVLSAIGFEKFDDRIFVKRDILCVLFKQNSYSYRLNVYANTSGPMKTMVKQMYQKFKDDILINLEEKIIQPKLSKKMALLDEIEAIQNGRESKEIITDRVFLS